MNQLSVPVLVREMKFEEVADTVRLFSAQGLHDSVSVVQSYYESDPASFAVAIDIVNKRVIGGCGAPRTTHNTSFLGCYVVESGFQGFGIGKSMFQKCLKNVGDRNCGLSAVPEKFGIYKDKAGFKVEEGVSMVIFQGIPKMDSIKTADKLDSKYIIEKINLDSNKELIKNLINFDATVHLDNRDKLLRLEISKKDTITLVVREKNTNNVVGYGCVRPDYSKFVTFNDIYIYSNHEFFLFHSRTCHDRTSLRD